MEQTDQSNPYARIIKTRCASTGAEVKQIEIRITQRHLTLAAKAASLAVALGAGVVMSLVVQGAFELKEPAWFCVNALFAGCLWYAKH
jgi:FtsH-binding integral membrane protein